MCNRHRNRLYDFQIAMEREWYVSMCLIYQKFAEAYNAAILYHVDEAGQLRVVSYEQVGEPNTGDQEASR